MSCRRIIYLASPYTHNNPVVVKERFVAVCKCASFLMSRGFFIISPIAHTHPIVSYGDEDLPGGWEYWETYDRLLIDRFDEVWVFQYPGWRESTGVQSEVSIAEGLGKTVQYVCPKTYDISRGKPFEESADE